MLYCNATSAKVCNPCAIGCRPGHSEPAETPAVIGIALLAQLVEHFHGKEGVVGSSPTEGFWACLQGKRWQLAIDADRPEGPVRVH